MCQCSTRPSSLLSVCLEAAMWPFAAACITVICVCVPQLSATAFWNKQVFTVHINPTCATVFVPWERPISPRACWANLVVLFLTLGILVHIVHTVRKVIRTDGLHESAAH